MCRLHGTQTTPPETAVVPPICSARSRTRTSAPPSAASSAALSAAPPDPTITTSATRSNPDAFSTAADPEARAVPPGPPGSSHAAVGRAPSGARRRVGSGGVRRRVRVADAYQADEATGQREGLGEHHAGGGGAEGEQEPLVADEGGVQEDAGGAEGDEREHHAGGEQRMLGAQAEHAGARAPEVAEGDQEDRGEEPEPERAVLG